LFNFDDMPAFDSIDSILSDLASERADPLERLLKVQLLSFIDMFDTDHFRID
jgi:hypothetical protein